MEELLLEILTKQDFTPKSEKWEVIRYYRKDFNYVVEARNEDDHTEIFHVSIDDIFNRLYELASCNQEKIDQLISHHSRIG